MPISTRFTEYGLTGAFFWLSQVLLLSLYAGDAFDLLINSGELGQILNWLGSLPDPIKGALGALIGTIGVIAIFVAGVVLELLPSIFTYPQMVAFRNTAAQNAAWLQPWTEACGDPARTDYRRLLEEVPSRYFSFHPESVKSLRHYARWQRLQALLFASAEARGKAGGDLEDQLHLWRSSRVFGNIMLLLALEVLFVYHPGALPLLIHFALYLGAFVVTLLSYHRLCYALFSRVCMLEKQS